MNRIAENKIVRIIVLAAFLLQPVRDAYGLSTDGLTVESGSITIDDSTADTLKITADSDNTILNWTGGFDIASTESIYFYMPSSSSNLMNRDTSGNISSILGALYANGNIYIINPQGITFGPNANIDVGGLVASSLSISNQDFLNGNMAFTKMGTDAASILNQGNITGDRFVALLSDSIRNEGVIQANQGTVMLASGKAMTLNFGGDNLIGVAVTEDTDVKGEGVEDAIVNIGSVSADAGKVLVRASVVKDVFRNAVNNEGVIKANKVVEKDGVISIVANDDVVSTGTLEAVGGKIEIESTGAVRSIGTLRTETLTEKGASFLLGGISEVGTAYIENADGAVNYGTGSYSGTYQDVGDVIINADAVITLTGATTFKADSEGNGTGAFTMNTGSSISAGIYNLYIYSAETATLRDITLTTGYLQVYNNNFADGNISLSGNITSAQSMYIYANNNLAIGGNITITGGSKTCYFYADNDQDGNGALSKTAGTINITNTGTLSLSSGTDITTSTFLSGTTYKTLYAYTYGDANITIDQTVDQSAITGATVAFLANGNLTINTSLGDVSIKSGASGGNVYLEADYNANGVGTLSKSGAGNLTIDATVAGYLYLQSGSDLTVSSWTPYISNYKYLYMYAKANHAITVDQSIDKSAISGSALYFWADGNLTIDNAGGTISLTAGTGGNIYLYADSNGDGVGNLSESTPANGVTLNASTTGRIDLQSAGNITTSDYFTGSALQFVSVYTKGGGNITVDTSFDKVGTTNSGVQFYSNGNLTIGNNITLTAYSSLGLYADYDGDGYGTLSTGTGLTLNTNASNGSVTLKSAGDITTSTYLTGTSLKSLSVYTTRNGNITVDTSFDKVGTSWSSVQFYSNGNLTIGNNITLTAYSSLGLYADYNADSVGTLSKGTGVTLNTNATNGSLYLQSAGNITTSDWLTGVNFKNLYVYTKGNADITIDASVDKSGTTGSYVYFYSDGDINIDTTSGARTIKAYYDLCLQADYDADGDGALSKTGTNGITLGSGSGNSLYLQSASDITTSTFLTGATFKNLYVYTKGNAGITIDQSIDKIGTSWTYVYFYSNGDLTIDTTGGSRTVTAYSSLGLYADYDADGQGTLSKLGSNTLTLNTNSSNGTLYLQSASDITTSSWISGVSFRSLYVYTKGSANITVDQSIDKIATSSSSVYLYSNGDLTINNNVTLTAYSNLALYADYDANGAGTLSKGTGVTLNTNSSSGYLNLQSAGNITVSDLVGSADYRNLYVYTKGEGNITINQSIDKSATSNSGLYFYAEGGITIGNNINLSVGSSGSIYLQADSDTDGSGTLSKGAYTLGLDASNSGTIWLQTAGDLTVSGWLTGATYRGYNASASGTLTVDTSFGTSSSITLKGDHDNNGVGNLTITGTIKPATYSYITLQGVNSFTLSTLFTQVQKCGTSSFSLTSTAGDITMDKYLGIASYYTLTLQAAGNLAINENIINTTNGPPDPSTFILKADYDENGVGNLTFTAGKTVTLRSNSGASVTLQGANSFTMSAVLGWLNNANSIINVTSTAGNITVDQNVYTNYAGWNYEPGLSLSAAGNVTLNNSIYNVGNLSLIADRDSNGVGALTFGGGLTVTTGSRYDYSWKYDLTLQDSANITTSTLLGNITGSPTGTLSITSTAGSITVDSAISNAGAVTLSAENGITQNANVTSKVGGITINANNDADVTGGAFTMGNGTTLTSSKGQAVSITASGASTLKGIAQAGNLTFTGATAGATFDAGASVINVAGNLTFGSNAGFTAGTSTITFNGIGGTQKLTFNGQTLYNVIVNNSPATVEFQDTPDINGDLTLTSGALDINGYALTVDTGKTFTQTNGILRLQGAEALTNISISTNSGGVIYDGSGTYASLLLGNSYNDLTFDGTGTWTLAADLNVADDFNLRQATLNAGTRTITVGGDWDSNAGTFNYNTSTVILNGDGILEAKTYPTMSFYNLSCAYSGKTTQISGVSSLRTNGVVTLNGGTFSGIGTIDLEGSAATRLVSTDPNSVISGSTIVYRATNSGQTLYIGGNLTTNIGINLSSSTSNVTFELNSDLVANWVKIETTGTGNSFTTGANSYGITLTGNFYTGGYNYANHANPVSIYFNNSTVSCAKLGAGDQYNTNVADNVYLGGSNISISGDFVAYYNDGTYINNWVIDPGTSTVTFTAAAAKNITSNGQSFYNVIFNNAAGGWTLQDALTANNNFTVTNSDTTGNGVDLNGKAVNVTGNFAINGGKVTAGASTITVGGSWDSSVGLFNAGTSSTVNLTGTGTLKTKGQTDTGAFYNIQLGAANQTTTLTSSLNFTGVMTIGSGTVTGNYDIAARGTTANPFVINAAANITGVYEFDLYGPASINLPAQTYPRIYWNPTSGAYTLTLAGNATCSVLTIGGIGVLGTVDLNGNNLNASSVSIGPGTRLGLLKNSSATTSTLTISGNLDISSGNASNQLDATNMNINIGGNWTNNLGASGFTAGTSMVTLNGTGTQTLTSGGSNFYGLTISNTTASGVQLADDLVVTNALTIGANGLLDLENYALTATGATFSNDGTLKLQGGQTVTGLTVDNNSGTVYYDGSGTYSQLTAGDSYYNLTINGAGTWTLDAALAVAYDLTLTSGTLAPAGYTITTTHDFIQNGGAINTAGNVTINATGNFNRTSGTITSTAGNVTITGTDVTVGGVTVSGAAKTFNATASSDLIVNGNISTTSGTLTLTTSNTGTFTQNSGTISSTSGTIYIRNNTFGSGTGNVFTVGNVNSGGILWIYYIPYSVTLNGNLSAAGTVYIDYAAGGITVNGDITTSNSYISVTSLDFGAGTGSFTQNSGTISTTGSGTYVSLSGGTTISARDISAVSYVSLSSASDITLNADVTSSGSYVSINSSAGKITQSAGTVTSGGTGYVTFDSTGASTIKSINSAGAVNLNKNGTSVTYDATSASITSAGNTVIESGVTVSAPSSIWNIGGNWTNSGSFSGANSTVTFNGTSAQSITAGSSPFYNLIIANTHASDEVTIASGTVTVANTLDVNDGIFTIGTSKVLDVNYNGINAVDVANGATLEVDGGTVTVDGGNSAQIDVAAGGTLNIVSGTVTSQGSLVLDGKLQMAGGTLNVGNTSPDTDVFVIGAAGGADVGDITGGTINLTSNYDYNYKYILIINDGGKFLPAVTQNDTGNLVVLRVPGGGHDYIKDLTTTPNFGNVIFNRLQIGDASYSNTYIRHSNVNTDPLYVYNKFTIYSGSEFNHTPANPEPLYIDKFVCDGTYTKPTSGANLFYMIDGDGVATNGSISGTSDPNFGNLDIGNGSAVTVTLGRDITVTSLDIATAATLDISNRTLTISGTGTPFTNAGTFTTTGSTVKYTGAAATNITTTAYNNLQLSGATTYSLTGNLTSGNALTGNLTIDNGATLDVVNGQNYGITLAGSWTNSGTFTARSGTVTFNAADTDNTITSNGQNFYDVVFTNGGTWTLQDNFRTTHNTRITNGTLDVGADKSITVDGTLTIDGGTIEGSANSVNITADALTHTSGTIKTTTSGNITINSTGTSAYTLGNITSVGTINIGQTTAPLSIAQTLGTSIQSTNSNIALRAVNNISLRAINAGTGNVTVWSNSGAIIDNIPDATNITAYKVTMRAYDNIGTLLNPIEVNVTEIGGIYSVTGHAYVHQAQNNTTIDNLTQTDPYRLYTDKSLSVTDLTVTGEPIDLNTTYGDVTLGRLTCYGDMYVKTENGYILSNGSTLSGTRIFLSATGTLGTRDNPLNVSNGYVRIMGAGQDGVYSGWFSGNVRIDPGAAQGIIMRNGQIYHVPTSVSSALHNSDNIMNEMDEERSEKVVNKIKDNYVNTAIQEVPKYEVLSPHIDTSNYTLPNLYNFNLNLGANADGKKGVTVSEHDGMKDSMKVSKGVSKEGFVRLHEVV